MDKDILKQVLKPILKEALREVLREEGILLETKQQTAKTSIVEAKKQDPNKELEEKKKKMLQEIGRTGYTVKGFDPFANTTPITEAQATSKSTPSGPLSNIDPNDPGVDISGIMNVAAGKWKAHLGRKSK